MEAIERALLEEVQRRFPLVEHPYRELGKRLGLSEEEVINRLHTLKESGILRQISAIFNPKALGYRTTLVAACVPPSKIETAARVINAYPGVSHNYLRDHDWNVWFTIAVPPGESLEETVANLLAEAGVKQYLLLPIKRVFRISLVLELTENEEDLTPLGEKAPSLLSSLSDGFISLVRTTQEDLPLVPEPFSLWGEGLGLSGAEILAWIEKGLSQGYIRRFAGLIRHTKAGFKGNVMVAWQVPEERILEVGQRLAREKKITHCYERRSYPQWPYNLYTMIHSRKLEETLSYISSLASELELSSYLPLPTLREFKKIRLKLFW